MVKTLFWWIFSEQFGGFLPVPVFSKKKGVQGVKSIFLHQNLKDIAKLKEKFIWIFKIKIDAIPALLKCLSVYSKPKSIHLNKKLKQPGK